MGILKYGIFGGFSNKVGNVVGRRHRGQDVITSLPETSNSPEEEGEIRQQNRFKLLNSYLSEIKPLVDVGFQKFTKKMSAMNAAFSYNFDWAFVMIGEELTLDFPKIVYSRGPVDTPDCPSVDLAGTDTLTFSWMPQIQSQFSRSSDKANFLIYNATKEMPVMLFGVANRSDLQYSWSIPATYAGDLLYCFMNFNSERGKLTGNSMYVGWV